MALEKLVNLFNEESLQHGSEIVMAMHHIENYRDDGIIIYRTQMRSIGYDFAKRWSGYSNHGGFSFDNLTQFERKIKKPEIDLCIQCSTREDGLLIAWHSDFLHSPVDFTERKTSNGKEANGCRATIDFLELHYSQMERLYYILLRAFKNYNFNHRSFIDDKSER